MGSIALIRHLGWRRSTILFAAILGYLAGITWLDIWVSARIGWPEAYGFSCQGRQCIGMDLQASARLLVHHRPWEIAKFILIWHLPALAAAILAPALVASVFLIVHKRWKRPRRTRIRQMD